MIFFLWAIIAFGIMVASLGALRIGNATNPLAAIFGMAQFIVGILIVLLIGAALAFAADYPPVAVLQNELHAHPGDALAKLVPYRGQLFQPRYLGAQALGHGVYSVKLKLDVR